MTRRSDGGSDVAGETGVAGEETWRAICHEHSAEFEPPSPGSRVGIALQTLDKSPLNGLRIPGHGSACGWYIWGGERPSEDANFYQPICVEHLADRCPLALPFLALPAGWRFQIDGEHVDVWHDAGLLRAP